MTRLATLISTTCLLAACSGVEPERGFHSSDPIQRVHALADAIETADHASIPDLIGMLDSQDPAVRMLAIRGLERLTGDNRGYAWDDPVSQRNQAISRWSEWWRSTRARSAADKVQEPHSRL